MNTLFIVIAVLMVLGALGFVIVPMLRRGRRDGRPRHALAIALVVAFALPLAAWSLYMDVGTPAALNPAALKPPKMTLDMAIGKLRQELSQHPDNLQGWLLLGRTYDSTGKSAAARKAYDHALKLAPDNADIKVAWAEADSMARSNHRIEGRAHTLLQQAVKSDPRNQRGLWLLGISEYQHNQFADAVLTWRRLKALLQPGTKVADAVNEQIAMANARTAGKTQKQAMAMLRSASPEGESADEADPQAGQGAHIAVKVRLKSGFAKRVRPDDTLYVFAKAVKGPPMPLAVARLKASALPTTVMLTDGMGMTPAMRLSSANKVMLTARISRSGQPLAAPGDLEGTTGPVGVHADKPVDIVIDSVH